MINNYAVCPGGEEAVLKTVGLKGLAGSNPVCGAICPFSSVGLEHGSSKARVQGSNP